MNEHERSETGVFDQDDHPEAGYLADAPIRRRNRPRPPSIPSAPLGSRRAAELKAAQSGRPLYVAHGARPRRGVVLPAVVLCAAVLGIGALAVQRLADDDPAAVQTVEATAVAPTVNATTTLFLQVDNNGVPTAMTAASLADDATASMVFLPVGTMVEVPGFGLDTLAAAGELGGVELATTSVENLLTIEFDHVEVLWPAHLTELVRNFDPLLVNNPRRLDETNDRGRIEVRYPSGVILLPAADTADYLARQGLEESDLDRMVRHQEFWTALLAARAEIAETDGDATADIDAFVDQLALLGDDVEYRTLAVDGIGGEEELYGVDHDRLDEVIVRLDPSRVGSDAVRTTVQLLNGVGLPGMAAPITEILNSAQASVTLADNAERFDHEVTQVVYYRDEQFTAAQAILEVLGTGELVKQLDPIDVIDVTVVVGADLAAMLDLSFETAPTAPGA